MLLPERARLPKGHARHMHDEGEGHLVEVRPPRSQRMHSAGMAPSSTAAGMTSRATLALALLVAGPLRCGGAFTRRSRSSALFSGKAAAIVRAGQALDARDFGAKGDGVHDDAPALQKAIDTAQLSRRKLALPAGIYLVRPPLRPPSASPSPAHHDSPARTGARRRR